MSSSTNLNLPLTLRRAPPDARRGSSVHTSRSIAATMKPPARRRKSPGKKREQGSRVNRSFTQILANHDEPNTGGLKPQVREPRLHRSKQAGFFCAHCCGLRRQPEFAAKLKLLARY